MTCLERANRTSPFKLMTPYRQFYVGKLAHGFTDLQVFAPAYGPRPTLSKSSSVSCGRLDSRDPLRGGYSQLMVVFAYNRRPSVEFAHLEAMVYPTRVINAVILVTSRVDGD